MVVVLGSSGSSREGYGRETEIVHRTASDLGQAMTVTVKDLTLLSRVENTE